MKKLTLLKYFCGLLMMVSLVGLTGCFLAFPEPGSDEVIEQEAEDKKVSSDNESSDKEDAPKDDDDDVIVAGTVDTSSDYSFVVKGAFVGMDEYSDDPVVILVGEFSNDSKETISYGYALDASVFQSGRELQTAYLRGASAYTYENIEPGVTSTVLLGWKLVSAQDTVEITVLDRRHYAKEVLFNKTFTIEELIDNTIKFIDEFSGIIDESQSLTV
ncbi:MAG: DUF5067 domain-containing protein [Coriobacteriia bacterium]|nr:DUF5067 domain-containing protein [Coriobacteriia bacterium]